MSESACLLIGFEIDRKSLYEKPTYICPACGKQMSSEDYYCSKCGAKISHDMIAKPCYDPRLAQISHASDNLGYVVATRQVGVGSMCIAGALIEESSTERFSLMPANVGDLCEQIRGNLHSLGIKLVENMDRQTPARLALYLKYEECH